MGKCRVHEDSLSNRDIKISKKKNECLRILGTRTLGEHIRPLYIKDPVRKESLENWLSHICILPAFRLNFTCPGCSSPPPFCCLSTVFMPLFITHQSHSALHCKHWSSYSRLPRAWVFEFLILSALSIFLRLMDSQ